MLNNKDENVHRFALRELFYQNRFINDILGRVGLTLKLDELLRLPMTFEVILMHMKYLRIHNISIYQNRFINEYVRKKKKVRQKTWTKKCDIM